MYALRTQTLQEVLCTLPLSDIVRLRISVVILVDVASCPAVRAHPITCTQLGLQCSGTGAWILIYTSIAVSLVFVFVLNTCVMKIASLFQDAGG